MDDSSITGNCAKCRQPFLATLCVCTYCAGALALDFANEDSKDAPSGLALGEYDLIEELGRGAMGAVYRARHRKLGREVALKVVLAGQFASANERRRFLVEAEAAAQLDHPNLVPLHELGESEGRLYYAMRLIEGMTLGELLKNGALPAQRAVEVLVKIARALAHAHQRGVLHRDLKPANVLIDKTGEPHVTDFGLARRMDHDASMTLSGALVGTPAYMAPEVTEGKPATVQSDIWSLGAMLYETLSGYPPFAAASVTEMLLTIREREPVPLPQNISRDLRSIIHRSLSKELHKRYASAEALAQDLERWQRGEPVRARPVQPVERLIKWMRRRPSIAALSLLALVLFIGGITGIAWQWKTAVRSAERAEQARAKAQRSEQAAIKALYAADMNLCQSALRANNLGRARRLLDAHRPLAGKEDCRGWEWRYLWAQCRGSSLRQLPRSTHQITGLAIAPDGSTVWVNNYAGEQRQHGLSQATLEPQHSDYTNGYRGPVAIFANGDWLFLNPAPA